MNRGLGSMHENYEEAEFQPQKNTSRQMTRTINALYRILTSPASSETTPKKQGQKSAEQTSV